MLLLCFAACDNQLIVHQICAFNFDIYVGTAFDVELWIQHVMKNCGHRAVGVLCDVELVTQSCGHCM